MSTAIQPAETRTLIEHVRWDTYVHLAEDRRGSVPRMTYDQGALELMSPRRQHERLGCLIGRAIETYSEVRDIEIQSVASTTFKRKDLEKGFEADEAYYVANADRVRQKEELDLLIDPPPDLVVEVEITTSAIAKMKLFAALGIPEVWRHDGEKLWMGTLGQGNYLEIQESVNLPGLTRSMIDRVVAQRLERGENAIIKDFRASIGD